MAVDNTHDPSLTNPALAVITLSDCLTLILSVFMGTIKLESIFV